MLANPSKCEAGSNKRKLGSLRLGKRVPGGSDAGKFVKVHGRASITESGPCKDAIGKHDWKVAVTFLQKGKQWAPAGFGFDQTMVK